VTPAVTFDFAAWTAAYPEFAACSPVSGQAWFDRAGLYFANDTRNPAWACNSANFAQLLYMLTSHVAWMNAPRDANGNPAASGQPAPPLVGRVNSATEGSVSVGVEWNGSGSPSEAWFLQTRYGSDFWQATAQFRTARYSALPTYVPGGRGFPFFGLRRSGW
jgi:hypothetical protein